MKHTNTKEEALLSSIFSDESPLFRTPAEPETGDRVVIRLRMARDSGAWVSLLYGFPTASIPMHWVESDTCFDWFEAELDVGTEKLLYSFLIEWEGHYIYYRKTGATLSDSVPMSDPGRCFRIIPGFHVPEWSKGAVQYQILVDRFRNGSHANDVVDNEYHYTGGYVEHIADWDAPPSDGDFRRFYGGDLQGVLEELDYLQSLGVEAIYFNPIFVSPSSHKYDTQDYDHVDPHLAQIPKDLGREMRGGETNNIYAFRYAQRVTDPRNLAESDALFAKLCQEMHRRGMKVILDGVFNHCGSFHKWMDREGIYLRAPGQRPGAYDDPRSPYRGFFNFYGLHDYESWWGVETLPKLNYEGSRELCEEIYAIAQKWASPPYSIDGWRLDVGADLGHSREFNHMFWKEFRRRVKAANPELLILAEHYGDASEWLRGDEWDTVMNYDAFMEPLTWFLTGMEKHSDGRSDELWQDGETFFRAMEENMARFPYQSLQCAMNELSNHDHSRFLTRTNRQVGRVGTVGSAAAGEGVDIRIMREAVVVQMTWPGAPTIYYGDEAGQVGWTDPDNRRTYPWGHENAGLIGFHQALTTLRRRFPVLRSGSYKSLAAGRGYIAYARFDERSCAVIIVNNAEHNQEIDLPLRSVGIADGQRLLKSFSTTESGFRAMPTETGPVKEGILHCRMEARSAAIFNYKMPR